MSAPWHTLGFIAQSITIGLALAFVAVLVKPELVNWRLGFGGRQVSHAVAVAASGRRWCGRFGTSRLGQSRGEKTAPADHVGEVSLPLSVVAVAGDRVGAE